MTEWHTQKLVVINDTYDRDYASNGRSRYGAYLQQRPEEFRDSWTETPQPIESPEEFAMAAWRVATAPVMVPGYVQVRPDLRGVTLHTDDEDGTLYVDICVPLRHTHIGGDTKRFPYQWQDWQTERSYDDSVYHALLEPESNKKPSVLATATVRVPGRDWPALPAPTVYDGPKLLGEARDVVTALVAYINDDAGPMVARVLGEKP
ncbi:hypothetical protein [Streptomyces sp. NBC_00878]|uniref:hypothetical protein n=1 Tax=Streptomyces sp. NBC_00878 TaxID=2975854 RepID=UPI002251759B|nr:hypothetical protein [Streptomyces sp. NBC_00878]MCX4911841.1 hypothetical protein [Streptomyces sp. NBC_00878]